MRVLAVDEHPFHTVAFQRVKAGGRGVELVPLPILRGTVDVLPAGLDSLWVTSDLQGVLGDGQGPVRQLGEVLADELELLALAGEVPPLGGSGLVLAGDLYSRPELDRRGGHGDVRGVWTAFARLFAWVVGVAGNHDLLGTEFPRGGWRQRNLALLDGDWVELGGLRVAGLSGVIGEPHKGHSRTAEAFVAAIRRLRGLRPDVLVLHEGPDVPTEGLRGNPIVRDALDGPGPLTICGHRHWLRPTIMLPSGTQLLNVDGRAIVFTAAGR